MRAVCRGKNFEMFQNFLQGFTTCRDETVVPLREQFVNYEQTRRNYRVTRRGNAWRDVNILKFAPRPGTHHPHPDALTRTLSLALPLALA